MFFPLVTCEYCHSHVQNAPSESWGHHRGLQKKEGGYCSLMKQLILMEFLAKFHFFECFRMFHGWDIYSELDVFLLVGGSL